MILDWDTPAGKTLKALCDAINIPATITVFGSAPLQMSLEPKLLSQDVDVFSDVDLEKIVEINGLGIGQRAVGIQLCHELNFRTTPLWLSRAQIEKIGQCKVIFPHAIDILIGKLHRLDAKDLEAFRVVMAKTGHPTEAELIGELQNSVDLFRPGFDESEASDLTATTTVLWQEIFGRKIDVRAEIIVPALRIREEGFGHDVPSADYLSELRQNYGKSAGN